MIREWFEIEKACGPEALQHKNQNKGKSKFHMLMQHENSRLVVVQGGNIFIYYFIGKKWMNFSSSPFSRLCSIPFLSILQAKQRV